MVCIPSGNISDYSPHSSPLIIRSPKSHDRTFESGDGNHRMHAHSHSSPGHQVMHVLPEQHIGLRGIPRQVSPSSLSFANEAEREQEEVWWIYGPIEMFSQWTIYMHDTRIDCTFLSSF